MSMGVPRVRTLFFLILFFSLWLIPRDLIAADGENTITKRQDNGDDFTLLPNPSRDRPNQELLDRRITDTENLLTEIRKESESGEKQKISGLLEEQRLSVLLAQLLRARRRAAPPGVAATEAERLDRRMGRASRLIDQIRTLHSADIAFSAYDSNPIGEFTKRLGKLARFRERLRQAKLRALLLASQPTVEPPVNRLAPEYKPMTPAQERQRQEFLDFHESRPEKEPESEGARQLRVEEEIGRMHARQKVRDNTEAIRTSAIAVPKLTKTKDCTGLGRLVREARETD